MYKQILKRVCLIIVTLLLLAFLLARNATKTLTFGISIQDIEQENSYLQKIPVEEIGVPVRKRFSYPMIKAESLNEAKTNINLAPNRSNFRIIFLRTSTEPWEKFELCAFYSAAAKNPTARIRVLSVVNLHLPDYFVKAAPRVKVEKINFKRIFHFTPLESWYALGQWNLTDKPIRVIRHLANAARHAYVWKYGVTYLDTDMITLRDLSGIRNSLAFQSGNKILNLRAMNGALLAFDAFHPFLGMAMRFTRDSFQADQAEGNYGPMLLTRMVPKYLRSKQKNHPDWPDIHLLPRELVYPFTYNKAANLFRKVGSAPNLERDLRNAYTVHLWRNGQRTKYKNPHMEPEPGTIFYNIMKEHCPIILLNPSTNEH